MDCVSKWSFWEGQDNAGGRCASSSSTMRCPTFSVHGRFDNDVSASLEQLSWILGPWILIAFFSRTLLNSRRNRELSTKSSDISRLPGFLPFPNFYRRKPVALVTVHKPLTQVHKFSSVLSSRISSSAATAVCSRRNHIQCATSPRIWQCGCRLPLLVPNWCRHHSWQQSITDHQRPILLPLIPCSSWCRQDALTAPSSRPFHAI